MKTCAAFLLLAAVCASGQTVETFQTTNPNYPTRNPFYFEGKITWEKLGITTPSNAWEYMQRGMYEQDDLQNVTAAQADYQQALSMNSLQNSTCQIVKSVPASNFGSLTPPPCMFTLRLRLAYLIRNQNPDQAIQLLQEVLTIDPLHLGVNQRIGETYMLKGNYKSAIASFQAELALSPVTPQTTALTGDEANNAHVHWGMAEAYDKLGDRTHEIQELENYLKATKWHSDVYPWRITVAQRKIERLRSLRTQ